MTRAEENNFALDYILAQSDLAHARNGDVTGDKVKNGTDAEDDDAVLI